ncbi:MAG: aminotransferase class I/II-fold pyridoxal phosphate-dependent enzyme [Leptospiraceae bacterium]|nr:aminotransferase class I/II-fold pyridoxal phosphate-dependent enzyme [Leptospiraceae bacterium]
MFEHTFSSTFPGETGISNLMSDLTSALQNKEMAFLGGGNPALHQEIILAVENQIKTFDNSFWQNAMAYYDPAAGNLQLRHTLADFLTREGYPDVNPERILISGGSQQAFFLLFNLLAGPLKNGKRKKVLLPMLPEYIGYNDLGLQGDFFYGIDAIRIIENGFLRFIPDFEKIEAVLKSGEIGIAAISRPQNPTGGVLSSQYMKTLEDLCQVYSVPLLVDCAYGNPFPGLVYKEDDYLPQPTTLYSISFSKCGLPGLRTGALIAPRDIIRATSNVIAVTQLANSSLSSAILSEFLRKNDLKSLTRKYLLPYYERRRNYILSLFEHHGFPNENLRIHVSEGAFFLWLEFCGSSKKQKLNSQKIYELLKARQVLVVPGSYFYAGLTNHQTPSCLRVSFTGEDNTLETGVREIISILKENY